MLHAASAGLLEVAWDLVCPECAQPRATIPSLGGVSRTGACPSCRVTYAEDLASTVELAFRPPRSLRETTASVYCLGSPAARPHVLVQQVLAPGEVRVVRARLGVGEHRVAGPGLAPWELTASPSAYLDVCKMHVKDGAVSAATHLVRAAEITFELENLGVEPALVRVETLAHRRDGVTAAVALSHPTLRGLMSVALLPEGEHVSVTHAAFLFVRVGELLGLFADLGDAGALALLQSLDAVLVDASSRHRGRVVEASSDGVIAAFPDAEAAVSAGLEIASTLGARAALGERLGGRVRLAVHQGRCVAFTRGDGVAYFGETVAVGLSLLAGAEPGTVVVSGVAADDPGATTGLRRAAWRRRDERAPIGLSSDRGPSLRRVVLSPPETE